jgi:hypothetical protein
MMTSVLRHFRCIARIAAIGITVASAAAPALLAAQSPGWELHRVNIRVRLDTAARRIDIAGKVHLVPRGAPQSELELELGPTGTFEVLTASHASRVSVDNPQRARLRWATPIPADSEVVVEVRVHHAKGGSQLVVTPAIALASWVTGWYPSPTGRSSRAAGCMEFDVPPTWRVLATGARATAAPGSERWCSDVPFDWSFVSGRYDVRERTVGDARVLLYALPGRAGALEPYLAAMTESVVALEEVFGPLPTESYGLAEIPDGIVTWGGSSEQGFFMAPTQALGTRVNLPLVAHELAHAWWGNAVQQTGPGSLMVTEALAQLGAALAIEHIEGGEARRDFMRFSRDGYNSRQSARGYFLLQQLGADRPLSQLTGEGQDHNLSDAKGYWVWWMTRDALGEERFRTAMQALQREFAGKRMSLADVRRTIVANSANRGDMERFLSQWLDRTGAPSLTLTWQPRGAGRIEVSVRQTSPLYDLRVPVVITTTEGRISTFVHTHSELQTTLVRIRGTVLDVALDPDYRILRWDRDYGPAPTS